MRDRNTKGSLSFKGRLTLGLIAIAAGVFPILAFLDVGPFSRSAINGPPWLGLAAGCVFVLAGIAVVMGDRGKDRVVGTVIVFGVIFGLAAIANWVAFGAGERTCGMSFSGFSIERDWDLAGVGCRFGFAIGAGILDGFLLIMLARSLREIEGPTLTTDFVDKIGTALVLISLAPVAVPVIAFLMGRSLLSAFREYRRTGTWPRRDVIFWKWRHGKSDGTLESRRQSEYQSDN